MTIIVSGRLHRARLPAREAADRERRACERRDRRIATLTCAPAVPLGTAGARPTALVRTRRRAVVLNA